jgi:hypothetical protein
MKRYAQLGLRLTRLAACGLKKKMMNGGRIYATLRNTEQASFIDGLWGGPLLRGVPRYRVLANSHRVLANSHFAFSSGKTKRDLRIAYPICR